jgi:hypothetical protein
MEGWRMEKAMPIECVVLRCNAQGLIRAHAFWCNKLQFLTLVRPMLRSSQG